MKTNLVTAPAYSYLQNFLVNIPATFDQKGETIYKARNEIKIIDIDGIAVVVKKYRRPHIINQIAYGYFRKSKAQRAFLYAQKLLSLSINTPAPLAFIEKTHHGLLKESYFISRFCHYPHLMRELWDYTEADKSALIQAFAAFTASIHNQQVFPIDYSPGNILFEKSGNEYHFALIDINRMQFKHVTPHMAAYGFRRLHVNEETLTEIAAEYAKIQHIEEQSFVEQTRQYHRHFWRKPH
jgi:serine/threonine protein kinase